MEYRQTSRDEPRPPEIVHVYHKPAEITHKITTKLPPVTPNLVVKIKCVLVFMRIGKITYKITLLLTMLMKFANFNFWHL